MTHCCRRLMVVLAVLACLVAAPNGFAQKPKLTLSKIEQLLQIPGADMDDTIATSIRTQGLSFTLNSKTMAALAAKAKNKPHTVAMLRALVVLEKGKIEVRTEPGSLLFIDGKDAGVAGTDGLLVLQNVVEGNHELIVRNAGYREANSNIVLGGNEVRQVSIPLEYTGGYLTVSAEPANAKITISGPQNFIGRLTDAGFLAGNYTATVSANNYVSQTRTFQISPKEHHVEQFKLVVDLAAAKAKANAGDPASLAILSDAIERGEQIVFNVRYTDIGWSRESGQRDGTVTLSKSLITFQPSVGSTPFSITPDKILEVTSELQKAGRVRVKVVIVNKSGKNATKTYEFYHPGTELQGLMIVCNQCDSSMGVFFTQMQEVRRLSMQGQMPSHATAKATAVNDPAGATTALAKLVETLGGQTKLDDLKNLHQIYSVQSKNETVRLDQRMVYPNKSVVKIRSSKTDVTIVITPATVYVTSGNSTQELPASLRKTYIDDVKRDFINVLKQMGDSRFTFTLAGEEKLAGNNATIIDVSADGASSRWWISTEGQLLQEQYSEVGPKGLRTLINRFSEWKNLGGISLPTKIVMVSTDHSVDQIATEETVETNTEIDPGVFASR